MITIYDSRKVLEMSEFPNLKRAIGVQIYHQTGEWLGVDFERVSINTASFGINVDSKDKALETAVTDTRHIVEHLDKVIAELIEQRERMVIELVNLQTVGIIWPD